MLEIISQIQSDRNKRTLAAEESLPAIMWGAAIGSGVIALFMSFFLFMEEAILQMIFTSIMASTIVLLLCITFVLALRRAVGTATGTIRALAASVRFGGCDALSQVCELTIERWAARHVFLPGTAYAADR